MSLYLATQELQASAINPAIWELNTVYLSGDEAIGRFLASVETVGFTGRTHIDAQWRALRKRSQIQAIEHGALFFEGIDPLTGDILDWVRCKPTQPRRSHIDGKVVKYDTPPKQPLRVSFFRVTPEIWQLVADRYHVPLPTDGATFWQWVQANPAIELVITEGEKKALSLLSAGYAAVSVPGINCGYRCIKDSSGKVIDRRLHPDLLPFANRRVVLAYDQDAKASTRLKVDGAIVSTVRLLTEAGALALVARWDGSKGKGVDDYIAAGGDVDTAIKQASSPPSLDLHFARKRVANRLGGYKPNLSVCVPCLSAIHPESIPESGIIVIIGNTGTGKTKLLSALQRSTSSALAPGHRTSLQRGLSDRLGLTYIKDADRGNGYLMDANGQPTTKIGLCWDSVLSVPLYLYPDGSYDLILDEADQSFKHLISGGTCGKDGKRPALVARAIELVTGAKRVILASATLTRHELDLVAKLRNEAPWILQNTYRANAYPITLYSGQRGVKLSSSKARGMVIELIAQALKSGERIIVATDQILITKMIESLGMQAGLFPHQILRFDRELSGEDWQREFADRPDDFLDRHDIRLLVHSPSLTSGVSIEGDHFDRVFGIFEGQTISPDDVLQALARVRKPIERVAYVSHYGVSSGAIDATRRGDYLAKSDRRTKMIALVSGTVINAPVDDPIANYHAATQADLNASMASFSASVQALLESAGAEITIGELGNPIGAIGLWRALKRGVIEADCWAKYSAEIIDAMQASDLRAKKTLKHSDALMLDRFDLCDWYAIDADALTIEDVANDRRGQTRREISRLEGLLWDGLNRAKDAATLEQLTSHQAPIQAHDLPGRELFGRTAQSLGILDMLRRAIDGASWHAETDWVKDFAVKMRQYADDVKLALGFRIHAKMSNCQIVGMVIKSLGFRTASVQVRTESDRLRIYQIDSESLDRIKSILQRRTERHIQKGFKPVTHPLTSILLEGMCHPISLRPPQGGTIPPATPYAHLSALGRAEIAPAPIA